MTSTKKGTGEDEGDDNDDSDLVTDRVGVDTKDERENEDGAVDASGASDREDHNPFVGLAIVMEDDEHKHDPSCSMTRRSAN